MEKEMMRLIKNINTVIDQLIKNINEIIECYRGGEEGKANKKMVTSIDDLLVIVDGIKVTEQVQKEKIEVEKINEYLVEMIGAFENNDYVLLCDLLEYEIIPILNEFKEKILVTIEG